MTTEQGPSFFRSKELSHVPAPITQAYQGFEAIIGPEGMSVIRHIPSEGALTRSQMLSALREGSETGINVARYLTGKTISALREQRSLEIALLKANGVPDIESAKLLSLDPDKLTEEQVVELTVARLGEEAERERLEQASNN